MRVYIKKIKDVSFITVKNNSGMKIVLSTFGASFYDLIVPDKNNQLESVVLTPTKVDDFYYASGYYGKSIGRFAGRIDKGVCHINDNKYELDINWNGVNSLHGGYDCIGYKNFDYKVVKEQNYVDVIFTYLEKENKLPGDVEYTFTYRIMKDKNDIILKFEAITTKDTHVNLTNHVYFNLSGECKRDCLDHQLQLLCDKYTRLNNELITLSIDKVNEVMDFRNMHAIKDYIYDESLQNHTALGYDHCFIKENINDSKIAVLQDEESGRRLTIHTSYPAVVYYAGCYPGEYDFNKNGMKIRQYHSTCLECQFIPNNINMDSDETSILRKGEKYSQYIIYSFDLIEN